jgi:hypothetical protein
MEADDFHPHQNRKLKNPEYVKCWAFGAQFSKDHFKKSFGITVCTDNIYVY